MITSRIQLQWQALYKVTGTLEPKILAKALKRAVDEVTGLNTDLPTITHGYIANFTEQTRQQLKVANMQLGLSRREYVRGSVFQTGVDECALLLTMPIFLARLISVESLLATLTPGANLSRGSQQVGVGARETIINGGDLPPMVLPYAKNQADEGYRQDVYVSDVPPNIFLSLRRLTLERREIMPILAAAWGLLLLEVGNTTAEYPLLLPGSAAKNSLFDLAFVALAHKEGYNGEKIVADQLAQITAFTAGKSKREPAFAFNHLLSFFDFCQEDNEYANVKATPTGVMISQNLWATHGVTLGVYFALTRQNLSIMWLYDEQSFKPYGIKLMAKRYMSKLQQIMADWKQSTIWKDKTKANSIPTIRPKGGTNEPYRLLQRLKLFDGIDLPAIKKDIGEPRLLRLELGARIDDNELDNCLFLVQGIVARNLVTDKSYSNLLDMCYDGAWLNETCLLTVQRSKLILEIMSAEAVIIAVTKPEMMRLAESEPLIERRMLMYALKELAKYQKLWVQIL